MKKYIGGVKKEHMWYENTVGYSKCDDMNYSNETKDYDSPEDQLNRFEPSWRQYLPQKYGIVSENVIYQKGDLLEQWTIAIEDQKTNERALMKVRMADVNPEIIEFDIEMAPIPNADNKPNDITMNWKLLSGFETNKTFYTDGNGLQMS
jgi:hypothetical protein